MPVLPSYRKQSIDLHSKSIDWFLYEGNTGIQWVNIRNEIWRRSLNTTDHLKRLITSKPLLKFQTILAEHKALCLSSRYVENKMPTCDPKRSGWIGTRTWRESDGNSL